MNKHSLRNRIVKYRFNDNENEIFEEKFENLFFKKDLNGFYSNMLYEIIEVFQDNLEEEQLLDCFYDNDCSEIVLNDEFDYFVNTLFYSNFKHNWNELMYIADNICIEILDIEGE